MTDQIQQIKSRIDIIDIIGEYVQLRKAGRNFSGRCPFHSEKTPSFMVNPELQMYKCFGCGESGDVYTFLQKHEGLEFYEALQILAKKAGIELKNEQGSGSKTKQILKQINQEAARFYQYILTKHPDGKRALDYLKNERRLSLQSIEEFSIGYSPEKPNSVFNFLNKKKNFKPEDIVEAGICYKGKYDYVDRFRGRIIFPIQDHRGSTIALAGRILPELSDRGLAKYINSPETPIYHKSDSVFGIAQAKHNIKKANNVVLTEGELDMISSWQHGVRNTVAIKGTALTEGQIYLLSRFTDTITLALDEDFAGDNAALKGITLAQNQNLEVKVASMKGYKDPDEFVKADEKGYKQSIRDAVDVWDYLLDVATEKFDVSTGIGKAKAAKFYIPFIEKIDDEVMRSHYIREFSRKIDMDQAVIAKQVKAPIPDKKTTNINAVKVRTRRDMLEETVVRLLFSVAQDEIKNIKYKEIISNENLKRILDLSSKQKKFDLKKLSISAPEDIQKTLQQVAFFETDDEMDYADFEKAVKSLELLEAKQKLSDLFAKIEEYEKNGKKSKLKMAQRKFSHLTQVIAKLED